MEKENKYKEIVQFLNTKQGFEIELDEDGFWFEEYDFTEHKNKDIFDIILAWENMGNEQKKVCVLADVSTAVNCSTCKNKNHSGEFSACNSCGQGYTNWKAIN